MAGKTDAYSDTVLSSLGAYVGLYTAAPSDAGGGTELAAAGYTRQSVTWGAAGAASPTGRKRSNSGLVTFGPFTEATAAVTHFGVFTGASGGTPQYWGALDASKTADVGDSFAFSAGDLSVTED